MTNLYGRLNILFEGNELIEEKLQKICQLLFDELDYYNWVGFYFKNKNKRELKLGPYVGDQTDHVIIPYGKGVCGQVAESNELLLIPDVSNHENYLSCSLKTKSEIVVPIIKNKKNIGQIDIDSHQLNPFTDEDKKLLTFICERVSALI